MTNITDGNRISAEELYRVFIRNDISYFCGVPDTILSPLGLFIEKHAPQLHEVAVNEGSAISMAIGHYMATSKIPLVYMQNSGLGNAINPLASLAAPEVMDIPMLLTIGWRGQPGRKDEPQHQKHGQITIPLLETLDIPHIVLSHSSIEAMKQIEETIAKIKRLNQTHAVIIEADTIKPLKNSVSNKSEYPLNREQAISLVLESLGNSDAVVATTGKTSRELFELRDKKYKGDHRGDLLVVGGMGHASSIALKIAKEKPAKNVYCIDGDGAVLMHMGVLAAIGKSSLKNFYHIVINNGAHESVGGQQTLGFDIKLPEIAEACGYACTYSIREPRSLRKTLSAIKKLSGPIFIEIRVNTYSRKNLIRPNISPRQNKKLFMDYLKENENA